MKATPASILAYVAGIAPTANNTSCLTRLSAALLPFAISLYSLMLRWLRSENDLRSP